MLSYTQLRRLSSHMRSRTQSQLWTDSLEFDWMTISDQAILLEYGSKNMSSPGANPVTL